MDQVGLLRWNSYVRMKNVYVPPELDIMCMDHSTVNCSCMETNRKVIRDPSGIASQFLPSSDHSAPSADSAPSPSPTLPSRNVAKKHTHPIMRNRAITHPASLEKIKVIDLASSGSASSADSPPESFTGKNLKAKSSAEKAAAADANAVTVADASEDASGGRIADACADVSADTSADAGADQSANTGADSSEDVDRIVKKEAGGSLPKNVVQIKITPAMAKMQVFIHPEASGMTHSIIPCWDSSKEFAKILNGSLRGSKRNEQTTFRIPAILEIHSHKNCIALQNPAGSLRGIERILKNRKESVKIFKNYSEPVTPQ